MSSPAPRPDGKDEAKPAARGDTFAWLIAAVQLIGPILLVIISVVGFGYALIHLLFLR